MNTATDDCGVGLERRGLLLTGLARGSVTDESGAGGHVVGMEHGVAADQLQGGEGGWEGGWGVKR